MYLCLQTYYFMFVKCLHPHLFLQMSPTYSHLIKKFPHFLLQLMIAPRKSVFLTIIMSTKVPFCKRLLALVNLLLHVILNFQSTRMILAFNIFSVFNLMALIYVKCYSNLSRRLTSYINQHNFVIMVFQLLLSLSSL